MNSHLSRLPGLPSVIVLLLSIPAYFLAYQASPTLHFGIGRWDGAFLADERQFSPPIRMSGPCRRSDDSVEIREFVGRLTKKEAGFLLPFHALRSPLQIHVRCHRFGLEGTVSLEVNDRHIEDFVFTERSYPWGGIRAVIPEEIAGTGPLRVELRTRGGLPAPSHLGRDLGLGVDWIKVTPLSRGVVLLPTTRQWSRFLLFVACSYLFLRFLHAGPLATAFAFLALAGSVLTMQVLYPVMTPNLLVHAWLFFPLGMVALKTLEIVDQRSRSGPGASPMPGQVEHEEHQ